MADTAAIAVMCSNCLKRPVADVVKCGFSDWCNLCDVVNSPQDFAEICCRQIAFSKYTSDAAAFYESINIFIFGQESAKPSPCFATV